MIAEDVLILRNKRGLHARASAKFTAEVTKYDARVFVTRCGETVRADSIMELLTLCASQGSQLHIRAEGREAHKSLEALRDLINNRFGEEE